MKNPFARKKPFNCFIDTDGTEDLDPYLWVTVPPRGSTDWEDISVWAREVAEELWEDTDWDSEPGPNGVDLVAGTLERCAESLCPPGSDRWVFLHIDHPAETPLPVLTAIGPVKGKREATLRALTRADDRNAVETPVVESVESQTLGTGLKTFRYVFRDSNLLACVRYAWRDEEHGADVAVWTESEDIEHVLRAAEEIDALARALGVDVSEPADASGDPDHSSPSGV